MIVLDVNVLVYAARREFPQHEAASEWLRRHLVGDEPIGVSDEVFAAASRLLTNHRVLPDPLTGDEALEFCDAVRSGPATIAARPTARRWDLFSRLVVDLGLRGNDIPDGLLAATALDLRASLATFDRGFRRFSGLQVVVPGG